MTAEQVQGDIVRLNHGDSEIIAQLENLRRKTLEKGQPYIEPAKSREYGYIKYLIKEEPGSIRVSDLDTNDTWVFHTTEPRSKRQLG